MSQPTRLEIQAELKRVYSILGKPFTRREYDEIGNIESRIVEKRYGGWSKALDACGLMKVFEEYKKLKDELKHLDVNENLRKSWQGKKQELLERAEERKIQWWKSQIQRLEFFKEFLDEALAKVEPPIVEVHPLRIIESGDGPSDKPHCTLWVEFSDLQLGTLMTAEEMGGLNRHNWIIWQDKLRIWKTEVIRRIARYRSEYIVDNVVVACLGDMVEGQDIFRGQTWQIDRHVVDQAILGASDTAAAFAEIFLTYPDQEFTVLEVFGNHGRTGRKGENPFSCSMDKVYQRMLELQLRGIKEITNVTYHQNEAWFYFIETYGWNHLLLHGDQGMSGMWSNRPTMNGLEKGVTRYNQMLQQQVHFVHCGHFHNDWQLSFNMSQILINGSFIGTSNFSASQLVASSPPIQTIHVFEPRVGLSKTERIHLVEGDVRRPIEPKSLKKHG